MKEIYSCIHCLKSKRKAMISTAIASYCPVSTSLEHLIKPQHEQSLFFFTLFFFLTAISFLLFFLTLNILLDIIIFILVIIVFLITPFIILADFGICNTVYCN